MLLRRNFSLHSLLLHTEDNIFIIVIESAVSTCRWKMCVPSATISSKDHKSAMTSEYNVIECRSIGGAAVVPSTESRPEVLVHNASDL